ncbi:MAG: hypothetical protein ACKV2T_23345 [Kofleriaceae bacterium]
MRLAFALVVLAACDSSGGTDPGTDAGSNGGDAGSNQNTDGGMSGDAGSSNRIDSTLTSTCGATLQGRAIVNFNGNLGVAFTEDDSPYTFLGSVQFELPDGYTGAIPNPEAWNGSDPRKVVAMTTPSYQLHGNHCWTSGAPSGGSVSITEYRPNDGVVKATFASLPLRSCTGAAVCMVSGTIETTGEGVFD